MLGLCTTELVARVLNATKGSWLPITRAASATENVTNNTPREKLDEWPPCLPHKLQHSDRTKDVWILPTKP